MKDVIHFYRVSDLTKALEFYTSILKFPLWKDQEKCLIFDAFGFGKIGFCEHFPKATQSSGCMTFVFETKEEVDAWHHHLLSLHHIAETPIINPLFNIYHFFVIDPNGLTLEFQYFLPER